VRLYHRSILEEQGLLVDEAVNGIEALEKIASRDFDLLLVDVNMPKLDGYGLLRQVRAQTIRQMPAVMISTEAREDDRGRAYEAGANYYIVKPIRPADLARLCRVLLGVTQEAA
jgi:two-component system chemotaxis response regulator CheY